MALLDKTVYDSITILEDGQIQLRRSRVIIDNDGVSEISRTYFRQVLEPGQDVTGFPPKVRGLCGFVWTPQVIADYQAAKLIKLGQV